MGIYLRQVNSTSYSIVQNPIIDLNNNTKYQRFTIDRLQGGPDEDVWRLNNCDLVTLGQTSGTQLAYPSSNWESAIQIDGETDLSCGIHGYEDYTAMRIYGDNVRVYPGSATVVYDNVRFEIDSNFYKMSNPTSKIGHINRIYYFNGTDLQLSQYYHFDIDTNIDIMYAGMFPVAIPPFGHGRLGGQSEENLRTRTTVIHADSDMITWRHATTGLYCRMEVSDGVADYDYNGNGKTWIRTLDPAYNKGYISRVNLNDSEPVSDGDTIHTRAKYTWWFNGV